MDLCDIHVGEKYILNVNEYVNMDYDIPHWMSQFADAHYEELPVVVEELDDGDMLDVLILPSYDDLPLTPNPYVHLWWVCSECLHELCTQPAFQNSEDLDELFENM